MLIKWKELIKTGFIQEQEDLHHIRILIRVSIFSELKDQTNDGVWNEAGTSIKIIISPPWWKTWWAYSSYACLFIFALYGIRRYELNRVRLKNQIKVG